MSGTLLGNSEYFTGGGCGCDGGSVSGGAVFSDGPIDNLNVVLFIVVCVICLIALIIVMSDRGGDSQSIIWFGGIGILMVLSALGNEAWLYKTRKTPTQQAAEYAATPQA